MAGRPTRLGVRLGADKAGATAIEYAIVLPALLLLLLGTVDVGRVFWVQVTLDRAVQAAARCAAVNANLCATTAQIQAYAASQAFGMTIAPSAFTPSTEACGQKVSARLAFSFIIPWLSAKDTTLTSSACHPD